MAFAHAPFERRGSFMPIGRPFRRLANAILAARAAEREGRIVGLSVCRAARAFDGHSTQWRAAVAAAV